MPPWSLVTGDVWSPVKFGRRCTLVPGVVTGEVWSPAKLVTGEVGHRRGHKWSWSPVHFGHRWGHWWSLVTSDVWLLVKFVHRCTLVTGVVTGEDWSPARSPVKLVTGEVGHRRGHKWSWSLVHFGHRWGHRWSLATGDVWSPVKFDHRCTLVTGVVTGEVGRWCTFGHRTSAGDAAGGRGEHALGSSPRPKQQLHAPPFYAPFIYYMKNNINTNKYRETGSSQVSVTIHVWFLFHLHYVAVSQPVAANSWECELAKEILNHTRFTVPKTDPIARPNTLSL